MNTIIAKDRLEMFLYSCKGRTMEHVSDIMKTNVVTVEKGTPVIEAIKKLVDNNFTGLPVVDSRNQVTGIISEKDVLALAIRVHEQSYESNPVALMVEDFMTPSVMTIEATESIPTLCSALMKNVFRRIPVVINKKLVGIVSRKDIISYILKLDI